VFFGLWSAFNWWYLLFYTDHYVDFVPLLEAKFLNPFSWIIGPAATAAVVLNYYLLGKRMEESFYDNYVRPFLEHKWLSMTIFFVVFTSVYQPLNKYFGETVDDIVNKRPNQLSGIIMFFGCFAYLYKVVFDLHKMKSVQGLLQSMLLTIIVFVIIMVFVIIACKISTLLIITYLTIYSTVPLLVFPFMNGSNPISQIVRMINDSRESCSKPNLDKGFFTYLKNFVKRNLFFIFIFHNSSQN
jgi:predicted MFS family arabinose efflux permease